MLIQICAWTILGLTVLRMVYTPFYIGKTLGLYTATSYMVGLITSIPIIAICGRVLGWW
jgi:hypothetical protein